MANWMTKLGLALGVANKLKQERGESERKNKLLELQGLEIEQKAAALQREREKDAAKAKYETEQVQPFAPEGALQEALPQAAAKGPMMAKVAGSVLGAGMGPGWAPKAVADSLGIPGVNPIVPRPVPFAELAQVPMPMKVADKLKETEVIENLRQMGRKDLKSMVSGDAILNNKTRVEEGDRGRAFRKGLNTENNDLKLKMFEGVPGSKIYGEQQQNARFGQGQALTRSLHNEKLAESKRQFDNPSGSSRLAADTSTWNNTKTNLTGLAKKGLDIIFPNKTGSDRRSQARQDDLNSAENAIKNIKGRAMEKRRILGKHNLDANDTDLFLEEAIDALPSVADRETFGRVLNGTGTDQDAEKSLDVFLAKGVRPEAIREAFRLVPKDKLPETIERFLDPNTPNGINRGR